jgi:transcriptional regulator with XRE-family HTH domain
VVLDDFLRLVGTNLKRARWIAGMTQEEVPGITLRYLQDLEAGRRNPTIQVLHGLAQAYGVTVADLTDVPGARRGKVALDKRPAEAPKAGRKPKGHPRHR